MHDITTISWISIASTWRGLYTPWMDPRIIIQFSIFTLYDRRHNTVCEHRCGCYPPYLLRILVTSPFISSLLHHQGHSLSFTWCIVPRQVPIFILMSQVCSYILGKATRPGLIHLEVFPRISWLHYQTPAYLWSGCSTCVRFMQARRAFSYISAYLEIGWKGVPRPFHKTSDRR
jgi:hypothetical protein